MNHIEYTIGFFAGILVCVVVAIAGFLIYAAC